MPTFGRRLPWKRKLKDVWGLDLWTGENFSGATAAYLYRHPDFCNFPTAASKKILLVGNRKPLYDVVVVWNVAEWICFPLDMCLNCEKLCLQGGERGEKYPCWIWFPIVACENHSGNADPSIQHRTRLDHTFNVLRDFKTHVPPDLPIVAKKTENFSEGLNDGNFKEEFWDLEVEDLLFSIHMVRKGWPRKCGLQYRSPSQHHFSICCTKHAAAILGTEDWWMSLSCCEFIPWRITTSVHSQM